MATYIVTAKGPSLEGFRAHQAMGFCGTYDQYAESAWAFEGARIFINGDLGPHCAECPAPSEALCDFPVGEGKTCDRPLCSEHRHAIGGDIDYCAHHHTEWITFSSTNGVMDQLSALAERRLPPLKNGAND